MHKKIITAIVAFGALCFSVHAANAQCILSPARCNTSGCCIVRAITACPILKRVCLKSRCNVVKTSVVACEVSTCEVSAPSPCEPVSVPAPCEPVTTPAPCEPVSTPAPCEPVTAPEPSCESECVGACPVAFSSLISKLNEVRERHGVSSLVCDKNLESGSYYQAKVCSRYQALVHGAGNEILAYNVSGIDGALNQWLNSRSHCSYLLNPNFKYAGVSVVRDRNGVAWCAVRFR